MTSVIPASVKYAVRHKYAWPGGYPLFLITTDGAALCVACGKSEWRNIAHATVKNLNDGWNVCAADINWDDSLYCDHCSKTIESAYGESND